MYCQRCRSHLKDESSNNSLNPVAFDLLVDSVNKSQRTKTASNQNYPQERKELFDKAIKGSQSPLYTRNIPAPRLDDASNQGSSSFRSQNPGMSFIEVTESQIVSPEKLVNRTALSHTATDTHLDTLPARQELLSSQVKSNENLYSILSSQSDIDHPVCTECSSTLVSQLSTRLAYATRERDAYGSFLKSLQQYSVHTDSDSAEKELDAINKTEVQAFEELKLLEEQKRSLEQELAELEEQNNQLDGREREFWESRNAFDDKLYEAQAELTSLQERYTNDQKQLERLHRTNVYNDTFCIGHDGYFGTINGLRLGRLPGQNVEWAEINAAWGQTLLLLATVAERLGFTFQGYKLRPLGSTSRIEKIEWLQRPPDTSTNNPHPLNNPAPKVTTLDLFSSGDMPLGRVFNHRRFDSGMVAFLDCLSQVGKHLERTATTSDAMRNSPRDAKPKAVVLPYEVHADKIQDVSIRLGVGFSQDENFTKACKYTLTCCKFLLAHVSNLETSKT